jgi:sugar phosphate isomerase/epimerase
MINRRKFLQNASMLTVGGLAVSQTITSMPLKNLVQAKSIGLQLYTVTNNMDTDPDATLKRLAEIGYKDLESASSRRGGFYGLKPKEFASKVKEYGLNWRAHHITGAPSRMLAGATATQVGPDGKPLPARLNLKDNFKEAVDLADEGGIKYLVCSSTPLENLEDIKSAIDTFNKTGEACKKAGIGFAFHNHTREFDRIEGKIPYDLFLSEVSADLMKFELDLGWATKSGTDPLELFKKYPGRFPLWHVKDLHRVTQRPVEVGTGYVDLKRVFDGAAAAGLEYFFVEQDAAPQPMENVATSYKNLKALIG